MIGLSSAINIFIDRTLCSRINTRYSNTVIGRLILNLSILRCQNVGQRKAVFRLSNPQRITRKSSGRLKSKRPCLLLNTPSRLAQSAAGQRANKPSLAAQHTRPCECCSGFCCTVQCRTTPKLSTQAAVRIIRKSSGRLKCLHPCKHLSSPSRLAQSAGGQRTNKPSLAARHTRPCECRPDFLCTDQTCSTPKLGT